MRLSVHSEDPGYPLWQAVRRRSVVPVVTVDGIEVRHCVTADIKRRIAVVADLDEQGKLQLNAKRDAVKLKVLAGKVSITLKRKAN